MATLRLSFEMLRQAFEQEYDKFLAEKPTVLPEDMSHTFWVLEELVCLLPERLLPDDQHELHAMAQRRLIEQTFVSESGDNMVDDHQRLGIHEQSLLITRTIERLRHLL